ncbi:glycoside hydrolase family 3 C-terminal domain-containing protein [Reichenbachiella ulvae]|uniref:Glycoside hydrolase family 3 C-terminal domain-containing protein n=1 Tax=Reichenbachiella ulvae TaxID=2980104 RepID=A0ABT3CUX5_9BACT|nr:glycoside hydrolase family 3 C-terminal domain-containing protein [Reichenbachiella ulvae]MCV9387419.1 glycoside hydrolase family 3 C-terminal domain-containing protein [Reichenbachiella ulvae]
MQEKIEQLYYLTDGNERLNIPQFTGSDGPHGIGNGAKGYSSFPVTIAMAATWDPNLITRVGRAISLEQAARTKDRIAGPTLDLLIDPRIGRAPETIGEDPFLGGRISEAFVKGQNTTSVFGSVKHYNLNTYEINRRTNNYLSDNRSLVEFWGYHWKRTVQQGGALSIMCAYNWVNGDKCAENSYLIKDLLRDQWGFNYYTMSDWGGFASTGKALESELDFCEGNDLYIKELPDGVREGKYDSTLVDRATRNILRTKILSGMMDGKPSIPKTVIDSKEHRALVYESGLKSLVLLKNSENLLPLNPEELKSVAVIGPNAGVLPLDGNSSSKVVPSYTIPVQDAMTKALGQDKVVYEKGCAINDADRSGFGSAIEAAKESEYVIFVGGLDSTVEGEGYFLDKEADEKGGGTVTRPDRPYGSVLLPGLQNELIQEIAKVNSNIILVVISGGTCSVTPVIDRVKGLLYAFYPGQEGGRAITDVILGQYNPSGKLPATIPKDDAQIIPISPDFRNMVTKGVGYRWFDSQGLEPEFAFGSGLSYTTFEYSNISLDRDQVDKGENILVTFDMKNIGERAGEEVAQLYLSTGTISPSIEMPVKQLRAFEKVRLEAGESKNITFTLSPEELYIYDETKGAYEVPVGEYKVQIGGASDQLPLKASFQIVEADGKPDLSVANIRTMPTFPKPGDEVVFMVSLINNGTAPTQVGDAHHIRFYLDGDEIANYFSQSISIPAGGMHLACAQELDGINWIAREGDFEVTAEIVVDRVGELNTDNNRCVGRLSLPNGRVVPEHLSQLF